MFKIKFCGIKDKETALPILEQHRNYDLYVGLRIGKRKYFAEMSTEEAKRIIEVIGDKAIPVTITYLKDPDSIIKLCKETTTEWLQINSPIPPDSILKLRDNNLRVILSLDTSRVYNNNGDYRKSLNLYDLVILTTNTFYPDWSKVATVSCFIPADKIIIGGWLHPDNMLYAIKHILPTGINIDYNVISYTFGSLKNLNKYIVDFMKTFEIFSPISVKK